MAGVFDALIGQPAAVAELSGAVRTPVHAYLLVGRRGFGTATAARLLAGELLITANGSTGEAADRHRRLAAEGTHPAITAVERVGPSITADQARMVVHQASLSPTEGRQQVIILFDFHLVGSAAPILLKSIEEPPLGTAFIVVADEVTEDLITIASRTVRIDFSPIPVADLRAQLIAEGGDPTLADTVARSAGGDLERARRLMRDPELGNRRALWASVGSRLDGTGHAAAVLADDLVACIDQVVKPLDVQHGEERAELDQQIEELGMRGGLRKELEDRHKREVRRVRTEELRAGLGVLLSAYRDRAGAAEVSGDGAGGGAEAFLTAAEEVARLETRLEFNPNERLALLALLVALPPLPAG
jgi:DNA polymerase-3 subunit delta'